VTLNHRRRAIRVRLIIRYIRCIIIDKLLIECRETIDMQINLKDAFKVTILANRLGYKFKHQMLQKIGNQNKLVGILMCLKYFKSLSKYISLCS
jgi:hypothetical protein